MKGCIELIKIWLWTIDWYSMVRPSGSKIEEYLPKILLMKNENKYFEYFKFSIAPYRRKVEFFLCPFIFAGLVKLTRFQNHIMNCTCKKIHLVEPKQSKKVQCTKSYSTLLKGRWKYFIIQKVLSNCLILWRGK